MSHRSAPVCVSVCVSFDSILSFACLPPCIHTFEPRSFLRRHRTATAPAIKSACWTRSYARWVTMKACGCDRRLSGLRTRRRLMDTPQSSPPRAATCLRPLRTQATRTGCFESSPKTSRSCSASGHGGHACSRRHGDRPSWVGWCWLLRASGGLLGERRASAAGDWRLDAAPCS